MSEHSDPVEELIHDFQQQRWDSRPFERVIEMTQNNAKYITKLLYASLDALPQGGTFLDAAMSFLDLEDFPALISAALAKLQQYHKHDLADSIIAYTSLQFPSVLHPHLEAIFELQPNAHAYYNSWPWRESGKQHIAFLENVLLNPIHPVSVKMKAWSALLETRDEAALQIAVALSDDVGLAHNLNAYFHEVGFEVTNKALRQLYYPRAYHFSFPSNYLSDEYRPFWIQRTLHPTWRLSSADQNTFPFGGKSSSSCLVCASNLHHIVTLDTNLIDLPITHLSKITLATCLSCLGFEEQNLFYKHEVTGEMYQIGYSGEQKVPEFPAEPLQETRVQFINTPSRWYWQDWALSNARENLHRVGGHPCWIQSAEYLTCPICRSTMQFLLQLDSALPTADNGELLWGSGGICYVCWCDTCKISGYVWQCT